MNGALVHGRGGSDEDGTRRSQVSARWLHVPLQMAQNLPTTVASALFTDAGFMTTLGGCAAWLGLRRNKVCGSRRYQG